MTEYVATCLINTSTTHWGGYGPGDVLAYDYALVLSLTADTPQEAAERAFTVGNRMAADDEGKWWPAWCRSLSVGDVVHVTWSEPVTATDSGSRAAWMDLAVAPLGYRQVDAGEGWNRPGGRGLMADTGNATDAPEGYCDDCGDPVHDADSLTCLVWRRQRGRA